MEAPSALCARAENSAPAASKAAPTRVTRRFFCPVMVFVSLAALRVQAHGEDPPRAGLCSPGFSIVASRSQFFEYESVSFRCEGLRGSSPLTLLRNERDFMACDAWTRTCSIQVVYLSDSGRYRCRSSGERSSGVNITVTDGLVILEAPAVPVAPGDDVTLRCRSRASTNQDAVFYRDDVPLASGLAALLLVRNVSAADEGVYRCSVDRVGASPGSRLEVRGQTSPCSDAAAAAPDGSDSPPVLILKLVLMLLLLVFPHLKHRVSCVSADGGASPSVRSLEDANDANGLRDLRERYSSPNISKHKAETRD